MRGRTGAMVIQRRATLRQARRLRADESAHVTFEVPTDVLCFTGADGRRIVEPGEFELQVGASSADIRLRATVTVVGETQMLGREWRMESRCVVEH